MCQKTVLTTAQAAAKEAFSGWACLRIFHRGLSEWFLAKNSRYFFAGRLDQIHFKLYAAVDRSGGYHADDLLKLNPTEDELLMAARWSMTHDVSAGYRMSLMEMIRMLGYGKIIENL